METVRGLLTQGNTKVGEGAHLWSLPALTSCPGASACCRRHCYARAGRFRFPAVRDRLAWNLKQAKRTDFAARMAAEVRRKGCLAVRVHVSGDFFSPAYAEAWGRVFAACPRPVFWTYTRSWRLPAVWAVMAPWAGLPNVRLWVSADRDTGMPTGLPAGVRVAWLLARDGEEPPPAVDLVFRVRRLRAQPPRVGLRVLPVCPNELGGDGRRDDPVTCGSCQRCLR